jgi:hypothetical protein
VSRASTILVVSVGRVSGTGDAGDGKRIVVLYQSKNSKSTRTDRCVAPLIPHVLAMLVIARIMLSKSAQRH